MSTTVRRTDPPHLKAAFRDLGLSEIKGPRHEARVLEMFALAGHPGISDDETAWCAAAVGAWLAEAGLPNSGSLMARSYAKYGTKLDKRQLLPRGAIAVWPRGAPPSGHVNIVLADDGVWITAIGGNQANNKGGGVTITRERKSHLVAAVMPTRVALPRPKPKPKLEPVPPPAPTPDVEDDAPVVPHIPEIIRPTPEPEPAPPEKLPPWYHPKRWWMWVTSGSGVGMLAWLTDPYAWAKFLVLLIAAGVVVTLIALVVSLLLFGKDVVREWVRKKVRLWER